MKKALVLAFSAIVGLASCSSDKKEEKAKKPNCTITIVKPVVPTAAQIKHEKDSLSLETDREFLAQRAALYMVALGDSLLSTEKADDAVWNLGAGFPGTIRQVERKFSSGAFRVAAGITFTGDDKSLSVSTQLIVVDSLGGKTFYKNSDRQSSF